MKYNMLLINTCSCTVLLILFLSWNQRRHVNWFDTLVLKPLLSPFNNGLQQWFCKSWTKWVLKEYQRWKESKTRYFFVITFALLTCILWRGKCTILFCIEQWKILYSILINILRFICTFFPQWFLKNIGVYHGNFQVPFYFVL